MKQMWRDGLKKHCLEKGQRVTTSHWPLPQEGSLVVIFFVQMDLNACVLKVVIKLKVGDSFYGLLLFAHTGAQSASHQNCLCGQCVVTNHRTVQIHAVTVENVLLLTRLGLGNSRPQRSMCLYFLQISLP